MIRKILFVGLLATVLQAAAVASPPLVADPPILTVEDARTLAADPSGKVSLPRLTTLSAEVAAELAKKNTRLELSGLESITDDVAAALAKHTGPLFLDGLKTLSPAAAGSLAQHYGYLSLNGITSLQDDAAKVLLGHVRQEVSGELLSLDGLPTISVAAAEALTGRRNLVSLRGISSLTPEAAAVLAEARAWDGTLPAFTTITADVAAALSKRHQPISLPGLTSLPADVAKALNGKLRVPGTHLKSLPVETLEVLAASNALPASLGRLSTLSEDQAKILANAGSGRTPLDFSGLRTLSPEVARILMKREGWVALNGLTMIPDDLVEALVEEKNHQFEPRVFLDGLTEVSDESAVILTRWPKWSGRFPSLTSISAPAAAAIGAAPSWDGTLPSLKTLASEAARGLAQTRGDLRLDGLTDLSPETAEQLATHHGGLLSLDGLKTLSTTAAAALAKRPGRLSLDGLQSLAEPTAAALAAHAGDWLFLDGLSTLDDATAKQLASHRGVVSLVGLENLGPAAAVVLHGNRCILLPPSIPRPAPAPVPAGDEKFVRGFLGETCGGCHDPGSAEGEFVIDGLDADTLPGRVAYASILERLQAGDMPPSDEPQPDPAAVAKVVGWIRSLLDSPLPGPAGPHPVREKPIDGNRLPHAILFGGPRGPSVPPPPRLWRLSPAAYDNWVGGLRGGGTQQPFGLALDRGFKDFAALYSTDESTASLLMTNAEQIVSVQVRGHELVNVLEKPDLAKERLWPDEGRRRTASAEERQALEAGVRVRQGNGVFAPLMHPKVRATRTELTAAIGTQFAAALARRPKPEELESLLALYDNVCGDGDMRIAGQTVLMAPLMSPEAVLRFEVGLGPEVRPGVRMLAPREVALACSYALSQVRMPVLMAAADAGGLATRDDVKLRVKTLLDDPQAPKSRVFGFFREYLGYHFAVDVFKDPLPQNVARRGIHYNPRVDVAVTDATVLRILSHDREVLRELLATSVAAESADEGLLRATAMDRGPTAVFRPLPASFSERSTGDRIGIPMHSSWLVSWSTNFHNDPVRRGRWIREQLLGGRVPDLPINAAAMIPDDPHRTLRERQSVTRKAECWKCHYRMDDLGLPFEFTDHYGMDQAGERIVDLETMEKTGNKDRPVHRLVPFDTTGLIAHSGDPTIDGPVRDAREMLRRLAGSDRVRQVFIRHVFRYFLGRNEAPGDAETLQDADRAYVESGGSFKAVLESLLTSESFLYRTVPSSMPSSTPSNTAG